MCIYTITFNTHVCIHMAISKRNPSSKTMKFRVSCGSQGEHVFEHIRGSEQAATKASKSLFHEYFQLSALDNPL